MALRNRVTPFNDIVALDMRGMLMGNRGRLHDPGGNLGKRHYTTRSWVACVLQFKSRHRPVMQPGRYTELFFLDEPTSLAAGHRPCGQCRYADYHRFLAAWRMGNGQAQAALHDIDHALHDDRFDKTLRRQKRCPAALSGLPNGAMIALNEAPERALLVWNDVLLAWSPKGYRERQSRSQEKSVLLLTPGSTVKALAAGYSPMLHPTAEALLSR